MKDLHIKVKESEYEFLVKLLSSFDFVQLDEKIEFSQSQKQELLKRYQDIKSGKVELITYDEFINILS